MPLNSRTYVQLVDIVFTHDYADDTGFHELLDDSDDHQSDHAHFHIPVPIHQDAQVEPDEPEVGAMEATVTLFHDGMAIELPRAGSAEWAFIAHSNILAYIEREFNVIPVEDDCQARFNHGLPHPLLNTSDIQTLLPHTPTEITDLDAEWFNPDHTLLAYEFPEGIVYVDIDADELRLRATEGATNEDLRVRLSKQLFNSICQHVNARGLDIHNPHEDIFHESLLYPALYDMPEEVIEFWNLMGDKMFTMDLANDAHPDLRKQCEDIGVVGHYATLVWLGIAATLEYEMPLIGRTLEVLDNHGAFEDCEEDTMYVNWNGTQENLAQIGHLLSASLTYEEFAYEKDAMPDADLVRIHAPDSHMQLAAEPAYYGPIYGLGDAEEEDADDFFWAENGWRVKIRAARPCGAEGNDFDVESVEEYFAARGGPYASALRDYLENAEPITEEEMQETMVLYDSEDSE